MSFSSFLNGFSRGFGFGMFSSNPFLFGGFSPFFGNPFMFSNFSMCMYPSVFSTPFYPLLPPVTPPIFNMNITGSVFTMPSVNFTMPSMNFTMPVFNFSNSNFTSAISDSFVSTAKTKQKSVERQQTASNPESVRTGGSISRKKWKDMTDSEMRQVYGNYDYDITKPYQGTASDLNRYLKGKGRLEGQGQAFLNAQQKYGISATALIGICCHESGKGKSLCAANNVAGVRKFLGNGKWEWRKFSSVASCVDFVANFLKSHYVDNPGNGKVGSLTKLYQVNAKYCPGAETSGNTTWASRVQKYAKEAETA